MNAKLGKSRAPAGYTKLAWVLSILWSVPAYLFSLPAYADRAETLAGQIFSRIAGAPLLLNDPRRDQMEELIRQGRIEEAARFATSHPTFTTVTMRSLASPLSNSDENGVRDLTDFTLTWMMIAHEDRPITDLLQADIVYTANPSLLPYAVAGKHNPNSPDYREDLSRVSFFNNAHYRERIDIDVPIPNENVISSENFYPLPQLIVVNEGTPDEALFARQRLNPAGYALVEGGLVNHFVAIGQNEKTSVNPSDIVDSRLLVREEDRAGILSSRDLAAQATAAGTNRRIIKWMFERFLCTTLLEIKDPLANPRFVRRDVDRAPGGDPAGAASCLGCHSIIDSMSAATGYFFSTGGRMRYDSNFVQSRVRNGSVSQNAQTYPEGHIPADNTWVNYATNEANQSRLGWRGPLAGRGLKALGKMFADSRAFSMCMAKRTFRYVCRRDEAPFEAAVIEDLANHLESNDYNIKRVFEKVATLSNCFEM